jgi:hypothetical protein
LFVSNHVKEQSRYRYHYGVLHVAAELPAQETPRRRLFQRVDLNLCT